MSSVTHTQTLLKITLFGTVNIAEQFDNIYRRNITLHNVKVRNNRYVFNILINCIKFCGVFELVLWDYDESEKFI